MSEKILNTRVILKHDTLENWNSDSAVILKEGEIALAKVSVNKADPISGELVKVPTYLIKVGDGSKKFSELNWVTAPAADVYDWAKKTEADFTAWVKTLVTVDDIDLSAYYTKDEVDGFVETINGNISDVQDALNGTITSTKEELEGDIADAKEELNGAIASAKTELNGNINTAKEELNGTISALDERVTANKNSIDSLEAADLGAYTTEETDAKISEAITNFTKAYIESDDNEAIDKLQEIADWIANDVNGASGIVADVAANAAAIEVNAGDIDKLDERVTANEEDIEALDGRVTVNEGAIKANADAIAALDEAYKAADETALAAAKKYTDDELAAAKTSISAEIDADVKVVNDALEAYKTANNAEVAKKANDAELAAVAKSGLIDDLEIGEGTVLIFDCGDSGVNA